MAKPVKKKSIQYTDAADLAVKAATGYVSKSIRLPEGMGFFPMKDERAYRLRFAPYIVGKGNPEAEEGSVHYTRKYYAHARIGISDDGKGGDTYICSRRTFGKACAVCDHVMKLRTIPSTSQEVLDSFKVKERQLFIVRDNDQKDKGWRILDLSYHSLGKQLEAKLKASRMASGDEDEVEQYPFGHFFHLDKGAVVKVLMEDPKLKFKFLQAKNIEIVPTKEVLDEEFLASMPCLDDLLIETPYKVLETILLQGDAGVDDSEDDDDTPPPASSKKKQKVGVEDDEDDEEEEEEETEEEIEDDEEADEEEEETEDEEEEEVEAPECGVGDIVKFTYKGKTLKGVVVSINAKGMLSIKCDDRDQPHAVDAEDIEEVVKKAAKGKVAKAAPKKAKDEDEDEDDFSLDEDDNEEEDEDEDEEVKKPAKKPAASKSRSFTEDEEDDDDFSLDEDEEDEKPAPKKGKK